MGLLMDFTNEGVLRAGQVSGGLVFVVTDVAYGASGFNAGVPTLALPLVPAATALVAEVFRKPVPPGNTTIDTIVAVTKGRETTYTSVGGEEFSSILGEAGIFATVLAPGGSGLLIGYKFLLAQAHFPRVIFSLYDRLAIQWPLDYSGTVLLYNSPIVYDDVYVYNG